MPPPAPEPTPTGEASAADAVDEAEPGAAPLDADGQKL
jgi:hypothetical protein